nr:AAA family ATPase [Cloacibacillus sp. An23]
MNGVMGAGKSSVSRELKRLLAPSFFLDGDWCWDMSPFAPDGAARALVLRNIAFMLNGYLAFEGRDNVIFCWVMHRREIVDDVLSRLDMRGVDFSLFTLTASEDELARRLTCGVEAGLRDSGVVARCIERRREFDAFGTEVDTCGVSPEEAARFIASRVTGDRL